MDIEFEVTVLFYFCQGDILSLRRCGATDQHEILHDVELHPGHQDIFRRQERGSGRPFFGLSDIDFFPFER